MTTIDAVRGEFDFGRVLERTFKIIGVNAPLFMTGALILVSAPLLVGNLLGLQETQVAGQSLAGSLGTFVSAIGGGILNGLIIYAATRKLDGKTVTTSDAMGAGARFFFPLLGLGIVVGLGVVLGCLLLLVPGIILAILWSVASPAPVSEEKGVFESLQRSRDLTRGHRWMIFGLGVVYWIMILIIGAVVGGLSFALGMGTGDAAAKTFSLTVLLGLVLTSLTNAIQGVIGGAGIASLYYELRSLKDGAAPDKTAAVFD